MAFSWRDTFCYYLLLGLLGSFIVPMQANAGTKNEVPLDLTPSLSVEAAAEVGWHVKAGDDAQQIGLLKLAERFYRQVLGRQDLEVELRRAVVLKLSSTLIGQQRFAEAGELLQALSGPYEAPYYLQAALVEFHAGDIEKAEQNLRFAPPEMLKESMRPWYYALAGLVQERLGSSKEADRFLKKAIEISLNEKQRSSFESIMLRGKIASGQASEALAERLKKKLLSARKRKTAQAIAKEYAIILAQLDRTEEAISLLEDQFLALPSEYLDEGNQLLILIGFLSGSDSEKGLRSLQEVLKRKGSSQYQKLALDLLATAQQEKKPGALHTFLNTLLEDPEGHPLMDELLLLRAEWFLGQGNLEAATTDAKALLERFPGSALKPDALRLLAYLAWRHDPPQYRIEADYLNQLKAALEDPKKKAHLSVLVADCYFLNEDYELASDMYGSALKEAASHLPLGPIFFQQVLSDLKAGNIELAQEHLDANSSLPDLDPLSRWRAEWNLVSAMQKHGKKQVAFKRIQKWLGHATKEPLPLELRLRLMWLEAKLSMEAGQAKQTPMLADHILQFLDSAEVENLDVDQREAIAIQVLFLKGQALVASDRLKKGFDTWESLRLAYPLSEFAVLTYFEEARALADEGRREEAQQRCVDLVEHYPQSHYAPIALYEAAIHAQLRSETSAIEEALGLLERITQEYRSHELFFYARLKQGDLLRILGQFAAAQTIYDNLIHGHPNHPERYLAELFRAKCLFALGAKDPSRFDEAILGLEKLFDLPSLEPDFRVEAGYNLAYVLTKQKNYGQAKEVYWKVISLFLKNPEMAVRLQSTGRYWMSRSILNLGELFESENKLEEAQSIYEMIISYELPGKVLAQAKLQKFTQV